MLAASLCDGRIARVEISTTTRRLWPASRSSLERRSLVTVSHAGLRLPRNSAAGAQHPPHHRFRLKAGPFASWAGWVYFRARSQARDSAWITEDGGSVHDVLCATGAVSSAGRCCSVFVTALRLLLALAVMAIAATPAQARVYSVIPADASGPNDAFLTNEILYAMGTSNALEGAAELCVVQAGSIDQGDCAEDAAWGSPNANVFQGTFPPQPIEGAPLPTGTWQILADNGDEDTDVVSAQFTVLACAPGDDCTTTISDAVMAHWKQAAVAARAGTG